MRPTAFDAQRFQDNVPAIPPPTAIEWCELTSSSVNKTFCQTTKHQPFPKSHKLSCKFTCHWMEGCQPAELTLHTMPTTCHQTPFPYQALSTDYTIAASHALHCSWAKPAAVEHMQRCNTIWSTAAPFPQTLFPILGRCSNSFKRVSYSLIFAPAAQLNDTTILRCP